VIDFYYWPTPNGWKVAIMLEECGLEYRTIPVNIGRGDQFKPEFLAISPNNRMPAIVDHDAPSEFGEGPIWARSCDGPPRRPRTSGAFSSIRGRATNCSPDEELRPALREWLPSPINSPSRQALQPPHHFGEGGTVPVIDDHGTIERDPVAHRAKIIGG